MFQIKVTQVGIAEFIAANKRVIATINRGDFIRAMADKAEELAELRAPKKTGKLIKAIKKKIINQWSYYLECTVENAKGEEYAPFVEEGTKHIMVGTPEAPRQIKSGGGKLAYLPFLKWAMWKVSQDGEKIFKEIILKDNYK